MAAILRRFSISGIAVIANLALQIGGFQNPTVAAFLWIIAGGWAAIALVTWEPVRFRVVQTWDRLSERSPVSFRSPVVRKPREPEIVDASTLGFVDFEAEAERAMKRMGKRLSAMTTEMERVGRTFRNSTPRVAALMQSSGEQKQRELREVGNRVRRHAERFETSQVLFRGDIEAMSTNYLNRMDYVSAQEAARLRPTIAGMSEAVDGARPGSVGMRQAALDLREQNVQQAVNLACDRLAEILEKIVSDLDAVKRFTTAALRKFDDRIAAENVAQGRAVGPNRRARRRTK